MSSEQNELYRADPSEPFPMRLIDLSGEDSDDRPAAATVVAMGNFDGLHIAHRQLILSAVETAGKMGAASAVFTFRGVKKDYLTDFSEKIRGISALGADYTAVADFEQLREMSPGEFFEKILIGRMRAAALVCGYNFRFGRGASGDTGTLQKLCHMHAVGLQILPPVTLDGAVISSTEIRSAIREGRMESGAAMLGRPFTLTGNIAHGRTVGRQNDCPTLNLTLPDGIVIPKFGVYFTKCVISGHVFPSVSNIGVRPTFNEQYGESEILCEVHLLGDLTALPAPDELYGSPMRVELDHFCRPERKFASPEALYGQIARDIGEACRYYHIN